MCREVKRIRISKLSSENSIFDEIVFHDGLNLILGEKYDDSTRQGSKTNGVGKSISVEFLDFCLLCDYEKSRLAQIPLDVFPAQENIVLALKIGEEDIEIRRNRKNHDKPVVVRAGKQVQFHKLQDAKNYLTELLFGELNGKAIPSFRNLLSLMIRDERSEFADILKCHDLSRTIPVDLTAHLFMLGISLEQYKKVQETISEIKKTGEVLKKTKKELTLNGSKKLADVKAEMNELDAELARLEEAMDTFRSNEAFLTMESELLEMENMLEQFRQRQKILKREYKRITDLPQPEHIDDAEIELVYNEFKDQLGSAVVKSLNDVVNFKNKVEEFQRMLINQKARELEKQISSISEQIRLLDEKYAEKIRVIDKKGVLRNLKSGLHIYESKREASAHTRLLFEQYEQYDKRKKQLDIRKAQALLDIDAEIEALSAELKGFTNTILNIHESIMGNKECSFDIKTKTKGQSQTPIDISLRIFDDGSHSVDRTKVFIYDMSLMFDENTRERHPQFLVHDNIFDVDQDTLVQCLNYIYRQEDYFSDFQYILTLNRDKIENEENRKKIMMNIDEHVVAVFTKKKKFLKTDYQER